MEKIPDEIGTAANVQAMVFGNMGDTSGTGVGFTRDPGSGGKGILRRIPDERSGRRRGRRHSHPASHRRSRDDFAGSVCTASRDHQLESREALSKDMQDIEFTIQKGKLYMLQTREW